jgi:hypothetical protein
LFRQQPSASNIRMPPIALTPRSIPSVDKLLADCAPEIDRYGRSLVTEFVRELLEELRGGTRPELVAGSRRFCARSSCP